MIAEVTSPIEPRTNGYPNGYQAQTSTADMSFPVGNALIHALDLLPAGVIVVDRSCRIQASNKAARYALETSDIIAEVNGFVGLTVKSQERLMRDAVRQACEVQGTRIALRISRPFGRPLLLLIQSGGEAHSPDRREDAMALVFLTETSWTHRADEKVLRELFGFTPAEARVAGMLIQGKSVETAAFRLGISENTARNHLKRLFAKTKTNKQGELVQLLLRSPALLTLELETGSDGLDQGCEYRAS